MPRKKRGSPLASAGPRPGGRPITWKLRADDRDVLHGAAARAGTPGSDVARELVEAAAAATPSVPREHAPTVTQNVRFPQELLDALAHSARYVGLDVSLWLMLLTTPAGDLLVQQLAAARELRGHLSRVRLRQL